MNTSSWKLLHNTASQIRKLQHFIWCKTVTQIRCQPVIRDNSDQGIIKVGKTEMINDFSWKIIRVWLKKLLLNDSGEYNLESCFQGRNKLLNRSMLEVLGENCNQEADLQTTAFPTKKGDVTNSTDDSSKDQRTLYALVVLCSFLPTAALIATVILLITTYMRRKRAGKGMDFGRHPSSSRAALQDRRNKASRMPDGEVNDSTTYAVIRHQPPLKPEDVIYANLQPSPQVFFHTQSDTAPVSNGLRYGNMLLPFRLSTPTAHLNTHI
ncbi:PREDICTED: uncharacterized protein LOC104397168 [Chaetura pelagica]|uniref:uncharacterized protein LOC104397168 n=1 Tax=Chaetura pelagica TaxID=8897 RepID=UPI000523CA28|nr:PREDICTED: uncharacterized protein LOC104397168 [Chaetura pelagica]